jgi:hypothetical protein
MDLKEIRWEIVEWIHLIQDGNKWQAVVNTVMNLRVPYKVGNFLTSWDILLTKKFRTFYHSIKK